MTASNHVITGAVIGAAVANPYAALPMALASHVALDALPHFGMENHTSKKFLYFLSLDAGIAAAILLSILFLNPTGALLIMACAIVAASPDLLWLPHWLKELQGKQTKKTKLDQFLSWVQWAEKPRIPMLIIEIVWLLVFGCLFLKAAFL